MPERVVVKNPNEVRSLIVSAQREKLLGRGRIWKDLFDLAAASNDALEPRQRVFHSILTVTAEAERELWESSVVPYRTVQSSPASETLMNSTDSLPPIDPDDACTAIALMPHRSKIRR